MRIEPLGDSAAILRQLEQPAYLLAETINAASPAGIVEAIASYETVGLYFNPTKTNLQQVEEAVARLINQDAPLPNNSRSPDPQNPGSEIRNPKLHSVPVCYDLGDDLDFVCDWTGMTHQEFVRAHSGQPYRCFAVGFCPGFPYLGYLPETIAGLPRKEQPRTRVTPGSVGITGAQTGIYPLPRPGGWQLVGRTPLTIVDPERDYFPIVAGDEVRFEPITRAQFAALEGQCL